VPNRGNILVIFEALFPDTYFPERATEGAAGYDVRAYLSGRRVEFINADGQSSQLQVENQLIIPAGARAAIPLGFKARLPPGIEAQLRLRSSIAFRTGLILPNSPATIDPDFPGEWLLLLANIQAMSATITHSERIAQIIFSRFEEVEWRKGVVTKETDRTGGFGSTGA
jgi:dUTP pyrophosphatase